MDAGKELSQSHSKSRRTRLGVLTSEIHALKDTNKHLFGLCSIKIPVDHSQHRSAQSPQPVRNLYHRSTAHVFVRDMWRMVRVTKFRGTTGAAAMRVSTILQVRT
jgi:hypothetical protein